MLDDEFEIRETFALKTTRQDVLITPVVAIPDKLYSKLIKNIRKV